MASASWYELTDPSAVATPALLFYPDRIRANIARAIGIAGRAARLRPHVKTHKCPQVTAMMLEAGITKFKCATLREAAMVADAAAGAGSTVDIVVAYPLYGPNPALLCDLLRRYPRAAIAATADCREAVELLAAAAERARVTLPVLLDLDVGMHRTGIPPGPDAEEVYRRIAADAHLAPAGLHAYDGHVRDADPSERRASVAPIVEAVRAFADALRAGGLPVPRIVAGGTPSFPCHADLAPEFELSPGTFVLHDWGYQTRYRDLRFEPAAVVLGRVVSVGLEAESAADRRFTVDIGSKAISTDQPGPRGVILNLPDAEPLGQSEEHWVFRAGGRMPRLGDTVYVLPRHVCPTVALHEAAHAVEAHAVVDRWPIAARARSLDS